MTAVNPGTGRDAWSVQQDGFNTEGGPDLLLLQSGYVAAWSRTASGCPAVVGISPDTGQQEWTSPNLSSAMFLTAGTSAVYVLRCTPWDSGQTGLCSSIALLAVAA